MARELIKKKTDCRVCKSKRLEKVLSFDPTPLANAFLTKEQAEREEYFFPLDVYFCLDCTNLQLGHVVSPEILFKNYVYVSSTSPVFVRHFENFAGSVYKKFKLNNKSLVIDIGSNDGILLKPFKKSGCRVLGIDPAAEIARRATKEGIETLPEFFSVRLAKKIVKKYGGAKIVTGTNVFAHIDDLDEVVMGVKILLSDDGVFITESPYLVDFIKKRYFDLVYHEHLSYWSVASISKLFKRLGMEVFDVQKVPVHGGSIRVFAQKNNGHYRRTTPVDAFLKGEKELKLDKLETYRSFAKAIQSNKAKLVKLLAGLKSKGRSIAAYGAPAKGNTLLNYFSLGAETLDFVVDDSPYKQGLYTPGKRIPVVSPDELYKQKPDYLLVLAWNFAPPIMEKHKKYKEQGGRFIVPMPKPKVI